MAVTYIVQQGLSATGPWNAVPGSPFSSASCSIAETAGNYYVQITAQDLVLGISSTPAVFGPYTIAINNPNAPNVANAVFFDDFTSENIAWTAWNPNGGTGAMATPGHGSVVLGGHTWTVTAGGLPQVDGATASTGSQVLGLWNVGGTIWIDCITDRWFSWNGSSWVSGSAPVGRAWLDHYPFGGDEYNLPAVDEQEYMCSSQAGYTSSTAFSPFSVSNSILSIKAQSVTSSGDTNPGSQPWNGGNISSCTEVNAEPTSGLFSFTYGYTEIRCQTPSGGPTNLNGPGFWPQMVLYPLSGVGPAEIDIFEILGGSPTVVRQTVHFSGGVGQTQFSPTAAINTGFHRVGVDWQPATITFYIDGVQTGQIATPATQFNAPFYINCGLAVAGSTSWGGGTPVNTQLVDPGVFQIDYIGVWPSFALAYPSAESPAGTTVTTVGPSINASPTPGTAGSGNLLTITSGGQIALNGTTLGGANVTELYYTGAAAGANGATSHTAYQENNAGNWYGPIVASGTGTQLAGSPIPAGPAIAISTIGSQTTNTPFSVSGTLSGYSSAPTLLYNDNGGTFGALPVSNTVSATSFTFTHPSITSAEAAATVAVEDASNTAINATSNAYVVQAVIVGAPGPPTALTSPGQTVSTITVSWAAPTTGGALDNGIYQVLYKTVAAGSYTNGPTVSYVTPGSGSFSALGGTWSVTSGGVVAFTGAGGPGTSSGVTMLVLVAGAVWQFNGTNWYGTTTPGSWPLGGNTTSPLSVTITGLANPQSYNIEVEVSNTTGQGIPCTPITAATQTSTGTFTISNGRVLAPSGNPFIAKGVCMTDQSMVTAATLISTFPGMNIVNFAIGSESGGLSGGYQAAIPTSTILAWVADATAKGLVVILSDYPAGQPAPRTGQDLINMGAWYASLAGPTANNNRVWWTTSNEMAAAGQTDMGPTWSQTYSSVRGAGNNGLIFFESAYGSFPHTFGSDPSVPPGKTGVGYLVHAYPGALEGATDLATANQNMRSQIQLWTSFAQSADGVMPVFAGEQGPSSSGSDIDDTIVNGQYLDVQSVDACTTNTAGNFCGYTMWVISYNNGGYNGGDALLQPNTLGSPVLTQFGQQVKNEIAANPPG